MTTTSPTPRVGVIGGSGDVGGVELLEGEDQRQRHCPAPGKLEEDQGLLQRAYCFGKAPCPLHALACLFLALPPLTCPRNASRVDAEAALRHHHRPGLTGDQGEEPYGVVRHRGIAQQTPP